jgi:hypothetical protein
MSKQDEKKREMTELQSDSPAEFDVYLETLKRIDDHVNQFNQMDERTQNWNLYKYKRKNFDAIKSNKFKRLVVSYHMEGRIFHEIYRAYLTASSELKIVSSRSVVDQNMLDSVELALKNASNKIMELRRDRIKALNLYLPILEHCKSSA